MDWLGRYGVTQDCGCYCIIIEMPGYPRVGYQYASMSGTVLSSFLYTLRVTFKELQKVRMVKEYFDVFGEIHGSPLQEKYRPLKGHILQSLSIALPPKSIQR